MRNSRVINISLEGFTSRIPRCLASDMARIGRILLGVTEEDKRLYYFNGEDLVKDMYKYYTDYGLVPLDVLIKENGEDTFSSASTLATSCDENSNNIRLSFRTISSWYSFFKDYYSLLKDYSHCGRVYCSAVDYYNSESSTKFAGQMVYGSELETYEEMDRLFKERGGQVVATIIKCDNNGCTTEDKKVTESSLDITSASRTN